MLVHLFYSRRYINIFKSNSNSENHRDDRAGLRKCTRRGEEYVSVLAGVYRFVRHIATAGAKGLGVRSK